ncbi:arp2 3 complex 21 kda subunit putative [Entamoeba histolytica]|nr:arp2 3 complex 21 kda subunit putative [Entamoeba histolytica]
MTTIAKQDKIFMKRSGAYHSELDKDIVQKAGNFPLMQFKTKVKVNPKFLLKGDDMDIVDEAITYYKANVFYKNFDMSICEADKLLVYLIFYIQSLLLKFNGHTKVECDKMAYSLAIENFALPGDGKFCLGGIVEPLKASEKEVVRQYMTAIRNETGLRLTQAVFKNDPTKCDKWWMCFNKRKFLNKTI